MMVYPYACSGLAAPALAMSEGESARGGTGAAINCILHSRVTVTSPCLNYGRKVLLEQKGNPLPSERTSCTTDVATTFSTHST
jgi:hypothetical protein